MMDEQPTARDSWFSRRWNQVIAGCGVLLLGCFGLFVIVAIIAAVTGGDDEESSPTTAIAAATMTEADEPAAEDPTATDDSPTATDPPEPADTPAPTDTPSPMDTPAPTPTATATAEPTPTHTPEPPTPTPTPAPPPTPITTSGFGDTLTDTIELSAGLAVFTLSHDGSSNFAIWFHEATTGDRLDLLVNEIGPFNGRVAIEIPVDSTYIYDVTANGNWSIQVIQPAPLNWEVFDTPIEMTGNGRDVRFFVFMESGLRRIEMAHDGSSNFAIWVYNSDASSRNLIVNEIGAYSGSTGLQVGSSGVFAVFDITADGNWTVRVE